MTEPLHGLEGLKAALECPEEWECSDDDPVKWMRWMEWRDLSYSCLSDSRAMWPELAQYSGNLSRNIQLQMRALLNSDPL
jgi:hypothetical protein